MVNAAQLVVLFGGFAAAVPIVIASVGGLGALAAPAAELPGYTDFFYTSGAGSGIALLALLGPGFIISPGLIQKVQGASGERAIRVGVGSQACVQALFGFIPVMLGMAARVAHPGIANPNLVLPTVLVEQMPPFLGALALAAIYSAEVSTCDAILFMLATSLSQDLYKRFLRPNATDRQLLRVARLASVVGGMGGVILALQLPTVTAALGIFYSLLGVSLFVPVLAGLYSGRAGTPEALAAIAAGVVARLGLQLATGGSGLGWDRSDTRRHHHGRRCLHAGHAAAEDPRSCLTSFVWMARPSPSSAPGRASARRWRSGRPVRARASRAWTSLPPRRLQRPRPSRRPAARPMPRRSTSPTRLPPTPR